jgi:hypothetical protein
MFFCVPCNSPKTERLVERRWGRERLVLFTVDTQRGILCMPVGWVNNITHGDHEASERTRRESMWEADLEHHGIEARIGAERIDEWIAK